MNRQPSLSKLGIGATCYIGVWSETDALAFLEHCHHLGAGGIQSPIHCDPVQLRKRAEELGMYVEAMVPLPHEADQETFEHSLQTAHSAGAVALRAACCGTRRYETFASYSDWKEFVALSQRSLETALPFLEKYKIPLGLENHKDWTADEMARLLKKYSSEFLGCCLDFGNNISLLDDPMEAIETLAPYAVSTHLKNMGVEAADRGFLLSEVLLGEGYLDLPRIVQSIRQMRPNARFTLEMITRDPLLIPCFEDKYWTTFPDRNGIYLARTMRFIHANRSDKPLPRISHLNSEDQSRAEEANVAACLQYANQNLGMAKT